MKFFKNTEIPEKINNYRLDACLQTDSNIYFFKNGVYHSEKTAAIYGKIYKNLWIPIFFCLNGKYILNDFGKYGFTKKDWRRYVKLASFI